MNFLHTSSASKKHAMHNHTRCSYRGNMQPSARGSFSSACDFSPTNKQHTEREEVTNTTVQWWLLSTCHEFLEEWHCLNGDCQLPNNFSIPSLQAVHCTRDKDITNCKNFWLLVPHKLPPYMCIQHTADLCTHMARLSVWCLSVPSGPAQITQDWLPKAICTVRMLSE